MDLQPSLHVPVEHLGDFGTSETVFSGLNSNSASEPGNATAVVMTAREKHHLSQVSVNKYKSYKMFC